MVKKGEKLKAKREPGRGIDYAALGKKGSAAKLEKYTAEELSAQAKRGVATRVENKRRKALELPPEPPKKKKVRIPSNKGLFKTMTPEEIKAFRHEASVRGGRAGGLARARNLGEKGLTELSRRNQTKAYGFANTPKVFDDESEVKFSSWGRPLTEIDMEQRKKG